MSSNPAPQFQLNSYKSSSYVGRSLAFVHKSTYSRSIFRMRSSYCNNFHFCYLYFYQGKWMFPFISSCNPITSNQTHVYFKIHVYWGFISTHTHNIFQRFIGSYIYRYYKCLSGKIKWFLTPGSIRKCPSRLSWKRNVLLALL